MTTESAYAETVGNDWYHAWCDSMGRISFDSQSHVVLLYSTLVTCSDAIQELIVLPMVPDNQTTNQPSGSASKT